MIVVGTSRTTILLLLLSCCVWTVSGLSEPLYRSKQQHIYSRIIEQDHYVPPHSKNEQQRNSGTKRNKRKLVRGQAWVDQQKKGSATEQKKGSTTDNIFTRNVNNVGAPAQQFQMSQEEVMQQILEAEAAMDQQETTQNKPAPQKESHQDNHRHSVPPPQSKTAETEIFILRPEDFEESTSKSTSKSKSKEEKKSAYQYYSYYSHKGSKGGSKGHSKGHSKYYSKSSKKHKGKGGSGKGNASSSASSSSYSKDYYDYYNYKKEKYDKKKKEKSYYGKGSFNYDDDDDYVYPTRRPTLPPTKTGETHAPAVLIPPTMAPHTMPSTQSNKPNPQVPTPGGKPTPVNPPLPQEPTPGVPKPVTPKPVMPPKPPTQTPPNQQPAGKCSVSSTGLYGKGDANLVASEFHFQYYTSVVPTVTAEELNQDMLPALEVVMGNEMLPKFFPTECKAGPAKGLMRKLRETLLTLDVFGFSNPKTVEQGEEEQRLLQGPLVLQGMSIKPRDVVANGETCPADVGGDTFPCFVIDGAITVFSTDQLDTTQRFQVENGIRSTVQSGKLVISDPRFLAISFDDFVAPPPTEAPTPENESWWSTFLAWINDTAWWILLLIVLGIVLVLVVLPVALCCICKRRRLRQQQEQDGTKDNDVEQVIPIQHVPMEDDEANKSSSSSSSDSSDPFNASRNPLLPKTEEPTQELPDYLSSNKFGRQSSVGRLVPIKPEEPKRYEENVYAINQALGYMNNNTSTQPTTSFGTTASANNQNNNAFGGQFNPPIDEVPESSDEEEVVSETEYDDEAVEDEGEYEIEYVSQTNRDGSGSFYQTVDEDENDAPPPNSTGGGSPRRRSRSRSGSRRQSNSSRSSRRRPGSQSPDRSWGGGGNDGESKPLSSWAQQATNNDDTPMAFLAMQQQQPSNAGAAFESLRQKWETT